MTTTTEFISKFPEYLNMVRSYNLAYAIDSYNRFYKPIEQWVLSEDTIEPSLTDVFKACSMILNFFDCDSQFNPVKEQLGYLLQYRLIFILNNECDETGKYTKMLEDIKNNYLLQNYDFKKIDITFEDVTKWL